MLSFDTLHDFFWALVGFAVSFTLGYSTAAVFFGRM